MGSFDRPSAGLGEPMDVYLHGYVSSRIMNLARDGEKDAGMKICVCATKVCNPNCDPGHCVLPFW